MSDAKGSLPTWHVDLLSAPRRSLASRLLGAQETWITVAMLVLGLVVSMISPKFATPAISSTSSRTPASSASWLSA